MRQLCLFWWGVTTETTLFFESKNGGYLLAYPSLLVVIPGTSRHTAYLLIISVFYLYSRMVFLAIEACFRYHFYMVSRPCKTERYLP